MSYFTVDPSAGITFNDAGTDIEVLWFEGDTRTAWLAAVIRAAFWQFKGQWRYDRNQGVDWLGEIFVTNPDTYVLANLLRLVLIGIPEISEIVYLTADFDNEELIVKWEVIAATGETVSGATSLSGSSGAQYPFIFSSEFSSFFA